MTDIAALTAERDELRATLTAERVAQAFVGSRFVADRLAFPADLVGAYFGRNFTIEDGRIVGKHADGRQIMSRERLGEVADFDEALEVLVSAYPHKDRIMKASGASGGGAQENAWRAGPTTISRTHFDAMEPMKRMEYVKSGGRIVDD